MTDMQKRFDTDMKDKCTSLLQMSVERGRTTPLRFTNVADKDRGQIEDIIEEFTEDTNMKKVDSPMEKGLNLPINTTADPNELGYRALVGALLRSIARCTRPDILFAIYHLPLAILDVCHQDSLGCSHPSSSLPQDNRGDPLRAQAD
jgi:hypothetical protein